MQSITCGQLLHIATYAAWSAGPCVCLSVGQNRPVLKRLNRSRCPLECGLTTQVGPRNRVSGGTIPLKRGQFGGWHLSLSCEKDYREYQACGNIATLFGRWQQRCVLSLAVLQQLACCLSSTRCEHFLRLLPKLLFEKVDYGGTIRLDSQSV